MESARSTQSASHAPRSPALPGLLARITEWFLRGSALRAARSAAAGTTSLQRRYRHYARTALVLAERARELDAPGATPATLPARAELYRQSAYWALLTLQPPGAALPTYAELWERTASDRLASAAGSAEAAERLRELVVGSSFFDFAAPPSEEQYASVRALVTLAHGLKPLADDPAERVEALEQQRFWRVGVATAILLTFVFAGIPYLQEWNVARKDLAAGKRWRASSEWVKCQPEEERCGNFRGTRIFFHTNDEASPWVEFDLGKKARFSRVEVTNRSDCCADRAVPLVIEVGADRESFRAVARRDAIFDRWVAEFSPVEARYVRLRIDRKAVLHLEGVRVLP